MVDGVCLEELSSMSFEDACLDEDCVLERGHTALDVAETTAELCDAYAEHIPVVAEFDGSRQFDKPARLLARDSSDASDVSSKLIEMFGRAGTTQLETETCYRDMVAWMCAPMAQGGRMVTSQLAAARSQLGVSQRTASQVHVELVESLTRAAQRDARVHQDERDFIEAISTLLRVDCPIVASPDVTHAVSLRKGMKVYFSGSFINSNTGMKIPKSTLRESAKDWGLENVDGVTKKNCDLLVVYDVASMSRSAKAARKWEIPVLSMEDFLMMIDCEIPAGS